MSQLALLAKTSYSSDEAAHVDLLRKLWSLVFGKEAGAFPAEIRSERWKDMGWQSDDPGRDIRGSGILSLHNLGYMAEHFPETFDRLMHKRTGTRSEWEYPFAAAGVNLTFMLSDMSGLYRPAAPATRKSSAILQLCGDLAQDPVEAHGQLFVAAYNILDDLWLQREASYMDFPAVLRRAE